MEKTKLSQPQIEVLQKAITETSAGRISAYAASSTINVLLRLGLIHLGFYIWPEEERVRLESEIKILVNTARCLLNGTIPDTPDLLQWYEKYPDEPRWYEASRRLESALRKASELKKRAYWITDSGREAVRGESC